MLRRMLLTSTIVTAMPTRIAFLSTAHIHARSFLEDLAKTEDAEVAAIWDDSAERGQKYASDFKAPFNADLDAVVGDDSVDAFVICDANTKHLPLLEKVLPTGKPTFCEKPLTTSVADAKKVAALVNQYKTPLCCGYFQPFFESNRAIKQAIDDGVFGKVTHGFFRNAHSAAYGRWFDSPELAWFVKPELAGGGALMDMGAHAIHLLLHLLGPVTQVQATISNVAGIYPDVDDYGTMQLTFASGAMGRAEAAWVQHGGHTGLELWGTDAALVFEDKKPMAATAGKGTKPLADAGARPDRMARLIAMTKGDIDPAELKQDLQACLDEVAVMEAAYASNESGKAEDVAKIELD